MKPKKVIIFGSSVAQGEGATNYYGWAYQLANKLKKGNYKVINKSVGGNRVKHLLKRVDDDILPLQPNIVIIAVSLGNEGLVYPFKKYRYNRFIKGIKKLLSTFDKMNIKTIITNVYPNNYYNSKEYEYVQQMNIELDTLPIPVINVGGTTDDLTGKWVEQMYKDAGHPNDQGHQEMCTAFPVALFNNLEKWNKNARYNSTNIHVINKDNYHISAPKEIRSYTLLFDITQLGNGEIVHLNNELSIHSRDNILYMTSKSCNHKLSENKTCNICLMYHPFTSILTITIDGNQESNHTVKELPLFDLIFSETHAVVDNVLLYRGRLSKSIREYISNKNTYFSSIELFATKESGFKNQISTSNSIFQKHI